MFNKILRKWREKQELEQQEQERIKEMQLKLKEICSIKLDLSKFSLQSPKTKQMEEPQTDTVENTPRFTPKKFEIPSFLQGKKKTDETGSLTEIPVLEVAKAKEAVVVQTPGPKAVSSHEIKEEVQPSITVVQTNEKEVSSTEANKTSNEEMPCTNLQTAHLVVIYYGIVSLINGDLNNLNSFSISQLSEIMKKINRCTFGVYTETKHQKMCQFLMLVKENVIEKLMCLKNGDFNSGIQDASEDFESTINSEGKSPFVLAS